MGGTRPCQAGGGAAAALTAGALPERAAAEVLRRHSPFQAVLRIAAFNRATGGNETEPNMIMTLLAHGADGGGWNLPPLHPILVNFTAALVPASVASDWASRWLKRDSLQSAAWWMMLYAAAITPFTVAAGWWWRIADDHPVNGPMWWHQWIGTSMALVVAALGLWRWKLQRSGRGPGLPYLLTGTLFLGALVVQADIGGRMSFGTGDSGHADGGADPAGSHSQSPHGEGPAIQKPPGGTAVPNGHGNHPHGVSKGNMPSTGPASKNETEGWRDFIELKE